MRFDVITLFPAMFSSPFQEGIIKKAIDKGIIEIKPVDLRSHAKDKHKITDDSPFGGGCGLVMKVEPIYNALKSINALMEEIDTDNEEVILLTPQGELFNQNIAKELSEKNRIVMICGRYEGVDERVRENFVTRQISVGDYVMTGGEFAAMIVIDSVSRLIKGVLGNEESNLDESHANGLLEYSQYTRPAEFMGLKVPDVLLSGDHKRIEEFRRKDSIRRTMKIRPDLIDLEKLSREDRERLNTLKDEEDD